MWQIYDARNIGVLPVYLIETFGNNTWLEIVCDVKLLKQSRRFMLTMCGLYDGDEIFTFRARSTKVASVVLVLEGF